MVISGIICQASVTATTSASDERVVTVSSSILFESELTFDKSRVGRENHRRGTSLTVGGRASVRGLVRSVVKGTVSMFLIAGRRFFLLRA